MQTRVNRQGSRIAVATLAATMIASLGAFAAPQAAAANTFVYRPGYQRFNRYVFRGHTWLRVGFFGAAAPGFYPSSGYLGFAPPPVYALPPYPAYAYPAYPRPVPYYFPGSPYAFGSPTVPYYYGPTVPYYSGPAVPFGAAFVYRGGYYRRSYYGGHRGYYRPSNNRGYRGYRGYYAHPYYGGDRR